MNDEIMAWLRKRLIEELRSESLRTMDACIERLEARTACEVLSGRAPTLQDGIEAIRNLRGLRVKGLA